MRTCQIGKDIVKFFQIDGEEIDKRMFQINCVRDNVKIIDRCKDWLHLSFLESLAIKEQNSELNRGLKSCKDLQLF